MKVNRRYIASGLMIGFLLLVAHVYVSLHSTDLKPYERDIHTSPGVSGRDGQNIEYKVSSESLTNYSMDIVLDSSSHTLSGTLILDYVNTEDIDIGELFFHLYPNASVNEDVPGYLLVDNVKTKDLGQDLDFGFGNQLLNITLPQALLPGESFSLYMEFETAITNNDSFRLNFKDDPSLGLVYALCNYYPILAVYDEQGWNLEPQYFVGDPYYSDIANYYVNLTVPSDFKVAASGELLGEDPEVNNQIEYEFRMLNARDFSFAISPDYIVEQETFRSIPVSVYYLPRDAGNWTLTAMDITLYSLDLFSDLYGEYPYTSFSVATTFGFYGGMDWPGIVWIQSGYRWFETGIAHEVAHQWFYAVVGNDQIDEGFLDEGIVCYCHWYYFENRYNYMGFFEEHLYRTAETSNETRYPAGLVINRSINYILENDIDGSHYWEAAYHKAPSVLHLLRTYIGDANFFDALERFYTQYSFQIATFNDLIDCFNYYIDINWFLPWFNEGFIPEVELVAAQLENTTLSGYNLSLTLKQTGLSVYPTKVPFLIDVEGSSMDELIWVWCNSSTPTNIQFQFDKKPTTVEIDTTSGYLYSLNLLEMEPFTVQDNRNSHSITDTTDTDPTSSSTSWVMVSPLIISLLILIARNDRRKK